ncbi:hypothetical protein B9Z55_017303 [Caenorhabditis nigoni]|uniref:Serpentine receptor class gamma n=1 Tax=Caenorhabditis nigoni TaxID=1611254 RepID=A0A2G5T927_9PELO|nr:hypothetical protein B9Z55_017303 [Caenorhabditis nigoni]
MICNYLNFFIIILPLLISVIRAAILLSFHHTLRNIQRIIQKVFILPILFGVPLFCVSFMAPSIGYCRQLGPPFSFGAIDIFYAGWFKLRNSHLILVLSFTSCLLSALLSGVMYFLLHCKLLPRASRLTKKTAKKAEKSITLTLISAFIPLVTNTFASTTTLWMPEKMYYFLLARCIGNDVETALMPWVLFLTHPMFQKEEDSSSFRVIRRERSTI